MFEYSADLVMSLSIKAISPKSVMPICCLKNGPSLLQSQRTVTVPAVLSSLSSTHQQRCLPKSANYGARTLHWWIPGSQSMLVVR